MSLEEKLKNIKHVSKVTKINVCPGYRTQASDTDIEADIYLFRRLRQLTIKQRVEMFLAHNLGVKKLALAGVKMRHRDSPIEEIRLHFARAVLGDKFPFGFPPTGTDEKMWIQDSISLASELHSLFESINIPYFVSGGVASSIHGETRSTRDLDLVVQTQVSQINLLVMTLESAGFYCPALAVEDLKLEQSSMLNITHTETIANADLYLTDNSPFATSQMARRQLLDVEGIPPFWVISPEDLVLQKLLRGSSSQSEKQWRDVLGILKLQESGLDYGYIVEWAEYLGLVDALIQALTEAGI